MTAKEATHCYYCEREFDKAWIHKDYEKTAAVYKTKDHIIPRAQGGISNERNYVYCCTKCNTFKGDLTLEQLLQKIHLKHSKHDSRYSKKYLDIVLKNVEALIFKISAYRETLFKPLKKEKLSPLTSKEMIKVKNILSAIPIVKPIPILPLPKYKDLPKEQKDWIMKFRERYDQEPEPNFHEK